MNSILILSFALLGAVCGQDRDAKQLDLSPVGSGYGSPAESRSAPALYGGPDNVGEPLQLDVRAGAPLNTYNNLDGQASEVNQRTFGGLPSGNPLEDLKNTIPGNPGEDYPILAEAPLTSFQCQGKINGGYYADPEAECQAFHICFADAEGSLAKYSFLCPNGTIFNQEYFICDWWFNVDCSKAASIAQSRNAELESSRREADARLASGQNPDFAASSESRVVASAPASYGSPENDVLGTYNN